MGKLFPYLLFDGNCREALRFYERALHGKIEALVTVAETPMASQFRAHARNRVIHGRLALGAHTLMASDWMAADPHPGIRGMRVMLTHPQIEDAERVFEALSIDGKLEMPLRATPFAQM